MRARCPRPRLPGASSMGPAHLVRQPGGRPNVGGVLEEPRSRAIQRLAGARIRLQRTSGGGAPRGSKADQRRPSLPEGRGQVGEGRPGTRSPVHGDPSPRPNSAVGRNISGRSPFTRSPTRGRAIGCTRGESVGDPWELKSRRRRRHSGRLSRRPGHERSDMGVRLPPPSRGRRGMARVGCCPVRSRWTSHCGGAPRRTSADPLFGFRPQGPETVVFPPAGTSAVRRGGRGASARPPTGNRAASAGTVAGSGPRFADRGSGRPPGAEATAPQAGRVHATVPERFSTRPRPPGGVSDDPAWSSAKPLIDPCRTGEDRLPAPIAGPAVRLAVGQGRMGQDGFRLPGRHDLQRRSADGGGDG